MSMLNGAPLHARPASTGKQGSAGGGAAHGSAGKPRQVFASAGKPRQVFTECRHYTGFTGAVACNKRESGRSSPVLHLGSSVVVVAHLPRVVEDPQDVRVALPLQRPPLLLHVRPVQRDAGQGSELPLDALAVPPRLVVHRRSLYQPANVRRGIIKHESEESLRGLVVAAGRKMIIEVQCHHPRVVFDKLVGHQHVVQRTLYGCRLYDQLVPGARGVRDVLGRRIPAPLLARLRGDVFE
eukprot:UN2370